MLVIFPVGSYNVQYINVVRDAFFVRINMPHLRPHLCYARSTILNHTVLSPAATPLFVSLAQELVNFLAFTGTYVFAVNIGFSSPRLFLLGIAVRLTK